MTAAAAAAEEEGEKEEGEEEEAAEAEELCAAAARCGANLWRRSAHTRVLYDLSTLKATPSE